MAASQFKTNDDWKRKTTEFEVGGFSDAWFEYQAVFSSMDYLSKAKTDWADWFACANIAVAAWVMICDLAKFVVSLA